jgi:hypothetical protein
MENQGVGGEQKLGDDQQYDVPFDAQAASGLHQAEQRFNRAADDVEFAIKRAVAVTQLVFVCQAHVVTLEFGMLP